MTLSENIAVQKRRIFIKFLKKNIEIIFRSRVQLTLLHVNDVHSHFEEVNINTSTCKYEVDYLFQKIQWIRFKTQSQTLITEKYVSVLSIIAEESKYNALYCFCLQKYEEISFLKLGVKSFCQQGLTRMHIQCALLILPCLLSSFQDE